MFSVLLFYIVGIVILVTAIAWNTLLQRVGVKSAYDLLKDPRSGRFIDYALFIGVYPLLLGAVSVLSLRILNN